MSYPDEYLIGIRLFNQGDYFESHEVWEALWKATGGKERDFYQGLIQLAVGLCHYYNGNMRGAERMYHRSLDRLQTYRPGCLGLDLETFLRSAEECFRPVLSADPEQPVAFDEASVPRIVLDPEPAAWPDIPAEVYDENGG